MSFPRSALVGLTSVVSILLMVFCAGVPLYVFPQTDEATRSDVIFVIGPPTGLRLRLAERLLADGESRNLMISVPDLTSWSPAVAALCNEQHDYRVYCSKPVPFTTQGEARWLRAMAGEQGWTSATVITFTPHVTRARIIMSRCFSGDLRMVADSSPLPLQEWSYQFAYQTGAFVKAALAPDC